MKAQDGPNAWQSLSGVSSLMVGRMNAQKEKSKKKEVKEASAAAGGSYRWQFDDGDP